jgi:hypothetical protein
MNSPRSLPEMTRIGLAAGLTVLLLAAAACNRQEEIVDVTTASSPTTQAAIATPTTQSQVEAAEETGSAPATQDVREIPAYQIVQLVPGDQGDELVVLLDPGDYDDGDIEVLMTELVDEFGPYGAHIVDDPEAVPLVLAGEVDPTNEILAEHYYARLEGGNKVVYMGPLSEFGVFFLGS